jgi:hypothetical protein
MINKTNYQKIHTSNLSQSETDRKWRIFEQEQANFHSQTSVTNSRMATPSPSAPPSVVSYPVASWTANFSGVSLNDQGNLITLLSGGQVSFYADYSLDYAVAGCPSCIVQFYAGLVTDETASTDPLWCVSVSAGDAPNVSGSIFVNVTIPNVPGVYYISSTFSLEFSCQPTTVFTKTNALGIVVVA